MDKLKQNLSIYENLLESESHKLTSNTKETEDLKTSIVDKIKKFVDKNL